MPIPHRPNGSNIETERFPGRIARGESAWNDESDDPAHNLNNSPYDNNVPVALNLARKALNVYRADNNYVSPCMKDPILFDPRPDLVLGGEDSVTETVREYTERMEEAENRCLECQAFVLCLEVSGQISVKEPEIRGMVAGTLFDNSLTGRKVTANLTCPKGVVQC